MKDKIKRLRRAAGLTQHQLGEAIGCSGSAVGMWEQGQRSPRVGLVPKLAEVLGCTIDELFGEEG